MDGNDLNPLLQDPGMVIHPPMLYMGYVGFSVAFSFAVAALIGGKLDATWARWTRPWTTAAWIFLTIGITLGSAWAYYELGWGGWWFWDPVENASFMPWLVGDRADPFARRHREARRFKTWTVLLAILAFSLSLLGTFLVRSGVLSSVHAFATDPARGLFILAFLVIVIGASLALYAWRAPTVGLGARFALVSRESLLLGNNVLLVVACARGAAGHALPAAARRDGPRQDLGRPAVLRDRVRAADDAARLPDGRRADRALEGGVAARPRRRACVGGAGTRCVGALIVAWLSGRASASSARLGFLMAFWIVAVDRRPTSSSGCAPTGGVARARRSARARSRARWSA